MKKWKGVAVAGLAVALSITCFGCSGTTDDTEGDEATTTEESSESSEATATDKYVSVEELMENMNAYVIVDARSADSFDSSHIAGAVNLHWTSVSNVSVAQGEAGWGELADANAIVATAATIGIDGTKPVVVYTDSHDGWGEDGRIYWTLREAGYSDVHILSGGWSQWIAAGGEVATTLLAGEDADPIDQVDTAYVKAHMDSAVLVDARAEGEYNGEYTIGEVRTVIIPGALNDP